MSEPLIAVRDLTRTYHVGEVDVRALRGVSLDVQPGEFIALTGPSGSGKSTFMHLLGCLNRPTSGSYRLNGRDVATLSKRELARRAQQGDRVRLPGIQPAAANHTRSGERRAPPAVRRGHQGLEATCARQGGARLGGAGGPHSIITRIRCRAGSSSVSRSLARSLTSPVLLLADEPTGNLDSRTSVEVMDIFQRLNIERGLTIVLVTHEQEIAEHGTRIVGFRDGRVREDHPVDIRRTAAEELQQLLAQADDLVDA